MAARMAWLLSGAGRMPSHWFGWILSRHCPEVKGDFDFHKIIYAPGRNSSVPRAASTGWNR